MPSLNSEVDAGQTLQENNITEASRTSPERGDVPRLQLCLRGPNMPGVTDVEIDLNNLDSSIFKAVQQVIYLVKTLHCSSRFRYLTDFFIYFIFSVSKLRAWETKVTKSDGFGSRHMLLSTKK